MSHYKAFTHQHLDEIHESLSFRQSGDFKLWFVPNRGDFTRGIWATAYTKFRGTQEEAYELYRDFYAQAPFTQLSQEPISLKPVVNTNHCHLHLTVHEEMLLISSAIDNLLKGASGQAVQNMNLMFGLEEEAGLGLKSIVY